MKTMVSHDEELKKIGAYVSMLSSNKQKSDEFLIRSGIHTDSGKLSASYKKLIRETEHVCKQK